MQQKEWNCIKNGAKLGFQFPFPDTLLLPLLLPLSLLLFSWWSRKLDWCVLFSMLFFMNEEVCTNNKKMSSIFGNTIKCKFTAIYRHSLSLWFAIFEPLECCSRNSAHERHRLHLTHMHCFSKITKWQRFTFFPRLLQFFALFLHLASLLFYLCSFCVRIWKEKNGYAESVNVT